MSFSAYQYRQNVGITYQNDTAPVAREMNVRTGTRETIGVRERIERANNRCYRDAKCTKRNKPARGNVRVIL